MANQSIGTAYINISPSSEGISGSIKKMFNGEGEDAGNSIASKLVSTLKKVYQLSQLLGLLNKCFHLVVNFNNR